jgi:hypothetical protein
LDESQKGKYTIIATRHIIKYNIHETVIDVASVDGSQASAQITRSKKESVERVKALKDSTLVADANQSQAEVARLLRS